MAVTEDRSEKSANDRATAKMKSVLEKERGGASPEADEPDDDSEDGAVELPAAEEEESDEIELSPTPRQQRRRERPRLMEQLESERAERERLARELAEVRGQVSAFSQMQRPAQSESEDPLTSELKAIKKQQRALAETWQRMTREEQQARHEEMLNQQDELNMKESGVVYRINQKQYGGGGGQNAEQTVLLARYPDIAARPEAWNWAVSLYKGEVGARGGRVSPEEDARITEHVMQAARQRFRLGTAPAPTQQERSRYTGSPVGGGGGGSARKQPETMKFAKDSTEGKMMRRMALAAFPHIARQKGDQAAIDHWKKVSGPGVVRELSKQKA